LNQKSEILPFPLKRRVKWQWQRQRQSGYDSWVPEFVFRCPVTKVDVHRPPWIENEDRIKTKTLMRDHINGIQVDILKYPALYTAPRLEIVS
jgi:hypothetical protein